MRKLLQSLEAEEERNIFVRIGLTKSEWYSLGCLGVGEPHVAAEKVLELVLRKHLLLVETALMEQKEAAGDS